MSWYWVLLIHLLLMGCVAVSNVVVSHPFSESYTIKESEQHESGRVLYLANYSITLYATNMFYISKNDSGEDKRTLGSSYYWRTGIRPWLPQNRDAFFIEFIIPTRNQDIRLIPDAFSLFLNQQKYAGVLYKAAEASPIPEGDMCDFYVRDAYGEIIWGHSNQFNPGESLKVVNPMVLAANQEYCFAIKFNIPPPMPENEFTLSLRGLDNRLVKVPFKGVKYKETHN